MRKKATEQAAPDPNDKLISLAMKRFQIAADSEQATRKDALDDLKFRVGTLNGQSTQWPSDVQTGRVSDGRPCLTMNRIPAFLKQVTNEQRQQRPAVQINPVGDGADIETAEIFEGLVRNIEVNSEAEIAYDTAFESMATMGFGFWRIITMIEEGSFDQSIKIERIKNAFTVYYQPNCVQPCYEDAVWCFIVADLTPEEYKNKFPDSKMASLADFATIGDHQPSWVNAEYLRVAEYFVKEDIPEEIFQTDMGVFTQDKIPQGAVIQDKRMSKRTIVHWYTINAIEVLEDTIWYGKFIPIIPVLGDDLDVDGKRYLAGMVRNAKDPQRMYNYQISAATEASALQPKAPFLVAEGQTEGHEEEWRQANIRNFATLTYKQVDVGGKPAPPPQRQSSDTQLASYSFLIRQADNDLKATTGIYDASLGEKGPDQSGRAILARQKQGDVANLNWTDNLARSIRHTGRVLIDLIPRITTKTKIQRIINPDQSIKHVAITNGKYADTSLSNPAGYDKVYDLGVGTYDVTVSVGPNYQSKRQEASASKLAIINAYPDIMRWAPDLILQDMDWWGAQQLAERAYKTLPPALQDQDTQDPKKALLGATATIDQQQQQIQQMDMLLKQQHEVIQTEQVKQAAESERLDKELKTKILIAEIDAKAQESQLRIKMEHEVWKELHGSAHELGMSTMEAEQPEAEPTEPTQ